MLWRVLLFVALWLALVIVTGPLAPPRLPWSSVPMLLAALVAGWLLLRMDGGPPGEAWGAPAALGFPLRLRGRAGPLPGLGAGLALGVAVALLAVVLIALVGALRWAPDRGDLSDWMRIGAATLWLLAIPAAAEEALLRGYPLWLLAGAWGPWPAILLTSAVFSLLHLANPEVGWVGLVNIAAAGVFLGALCLRTGGLWWPTGAHLGWNWAQAFLADVPVSGLELVDAPLLEPCFAGPAWLSGGAFGPEGSVLTTAAMLAAAAWTWRTPRLASEAQGRRDPGGTEGE